jgi:hypothetical protein
MTRYNPGSSCFSKPSGACTTNTITNMFMISGITTNRVAKPISISIEQINSARNASISVLVWPIPTGSANCIGSPEKSIMYFLAPCVSIKQLTTILKRNSPVWYSFLSLVVSNNHMIIVE